MKVNRFRIASLSRDPSFLLRTVLWILIPGLAIAFIISLCRGTTKGPRVNSDKDPGIEITSRKECVHLLEKTRTSQRRTEDLLDASNPEKQLKEALERLREAIPDNSLPPGTETYLRPEEVKLFISYRVKMEFFRKMKPEEIEPFAKAADADPVSGFICSMHGDLLWASGEYEPALATYERGSADPDTGADCCRRALNLCRNRGWLEKMRNLYRQPGWRDAVLDTDRQFDSHADKIASLAADWQGLLKLSWQYLRINLQHPEWVTMSVLGGVLWFLIIHMGACVPFRLWWRGLLGFGLGVLSIPLTLFFITLESTWLNFRTDHELEDVISCISGIGLREELAKLILFTPMIFLLRKAPAAHVLAVAASVGLGFAIEENVGYFAGGSDVWGRFITANFLHFGLTGLTGLALWQAVRNSAWLSHFVWIFVGAVVYHGLVDYRPTDPRIAHDYNYFIYAGLAVLSLYFFRELSRYAQPVPGVPSALFVFLAGGALLLTVVMGFTAWSLGFRLALVATYKPVLDFFIIGAAMYYQLRNL